jgi:formamidopyrimidine-DNA glycosylase
VPELPEVETVVRDLAPLLVGRRFAAVKVGRKALRRKWSGGWTGALLDRTVRSIHRRGKWIVIRLDPPRFLVIHLGMTGQLTVVPLPSPRQTHTHLIIDLERGGQLRFRDIRRFGSATVFRSQSEVERFFRLTELGPEPFDLSAKYWRQRLESTRRCIKAVLLDQRVVAGIGNIYADEALFEARVHPARQALDLKPAEAQRLRKAIAAVLTRAIDKRGSSIRDYVGGSGLRGGYQEEFRVYGCTGAACTRCGATIERTRLAGRSTHYCPRCQRSE